MAEWDAEVVVDAALVRELLTEQLPELDAGSARLLGEGWDNSVWVVDEQWAFRFPRRAIAIPGVERELVVLPRLAPMLPVPIPVPRFVGVPTDRYPWPFFGAPLLTGLEVADAGVKDTDRIALAPALARFLRALHAATTLEAVDPDRTLPVDLNRRADMTFRVRRVRENLASLAQLGLWRAPPEVEQVLASAERLPASSTELVLAHGDLHLRHVLLESGSLTAVIDWGDVCLADPCIDLILVWSLLPPAGRQPFLDEYGPVSDEQLLRARVLALGLDSILVRYAHDAGNTALLREGTAALERTLAA
jgi:aminoglycoside phosphotransferase (APT) family kinase protein